jgi:hypothetical protein
MNTINEQPRADQAAGEDSETRQFKAFEERVKLNLKVPDWNRRTLQFYIQRPDLIPLALENGFDTNQVNDPERALGYIERAIWSEQFQADMASRQLIIWLFRQSKLTDEVILHSPYDPDEPDYNC